MGEMKQFKMYIGGEWVDAVNKETFITVHPANQQPIAEVPKGTEEDIELAVRSAKEVFESEEWQNYHAVDRGRSLYTIAQKLLERKDEIAELESLDTGKPISQARADVVNAARYFEYYAGAADKVFGETIPVHPDILDYTVREPIGVTAHIIPWNYPLQITARGTAAALAMGNTVVVKPAEDTPLTALKLAEIIEETDLPKGVYQVVTGYGYDAGTALSNHPDVDQITFTGSVVTGSAVMMAAAKNVKPVTMELGGKSPNIVFADADLEDAANWVVRSIVQNAGQTCSAGARILIEAKIFEQFTQKVKERFEKIRIGSGMTDPDLGPIISQKQFERIEAMVERAIADGAIAVTGGKREHVDGYETGYFFQPTLLTNVDPQSEIAQEEVFGPVVCAFSFETEEEAIALANGTNYGLVTGIWTSDAKRAHRLAKRVRSGQVFINNYGAAGGVEMPFGGYKKSGFGREKGIEALQNYTQLKNVAVKLT